MSGKGHNRRPYDAKKWDDGYSRAFRKKSWFEKILDCIVSLVKTYLK